ncbi:amidase [Lichenihabitans sp. PAMC28606]|uniref:amidase n=1 Tax=Lichenihabitans sp. PAMC28606 TaxID=2880932 RepID=UPI001D0BBBA2|nr:amidase [Lichenihabitans sp. PAMC28606]UDL95991.1 amidase [Lichenihabitans sp. PAMC28606]
MTDMWQLGVADLATAFRTGRLDPVAVLDVSLDRIARIDPLLNSIVTLDAAGARAAAQDSAARWKAGTALSSLDGIPMTIKDNLLVDGLRATWGSHAYADHVPDHDEIPVERLRRAGVVIVGKTNVPELTLEGYTSNTLFGTTGNPWDPALTPGGSSGGAAASVAAGLVSAAIGTDAGGSIRRPASHTGLVGFKPSIGHVARGDGFLETVADCEVVGTLTRSVADAMLLDAVLAGPDVRDPRSALVSVPLAADPTRLRILYVPRFDDAPLDPEIEAATDRAAAALTGMGHVVEQGGVFFDRLAVDEAWRVIGRAGVARAFRAAGQRLRLQGGPTIQAMAQEGERLSAADYVDAMEVVTALRRRIADLFTRYDLVLTPSAAALPWPAADAFPPMIDGQTVGPRGHAIYTGWVNLAGNPGLAMPLGFSRSGLPIGGQVVSRFGSDAGLLSFGASFEAAHAPAWAFPPLTAG